MSFLRGFSIAMGANIVVFALSFLNNKLIYLLLPESDNGVYFLVMRSALFTALLLGDWLRLSNVNIAGGEKKLIPVLSANGFWYSLLLGCGLTVLFFLAAPLLPESLAGVPARLLPVVFFVGAGLVARNNWQSLLLVSHRMFSYGFTFILWMGLFLLLDVIFLVVFRFGLNFVFAALAVATLASAVWAFVSNAVANGHTFKPSLEVLGMSGRIGLRAWIAVIGMFLMTNVHAFSIKPFAGPGADGLVMVAVFSVGFRIFTLFQRGADVAGTVLYSYVVQESESAASRLTGKVARNILLVSMVFAVFAALAGKALIVVVSSSRYVSAYTPLLLMLPGIVSVNVGSVLNSYYWGRAYPLHVILAPYAASAAGVALNMYLVPRMGAGGATLSFSIMCAVWFLYLLGGFVHDTGGRFREVLVPRISDYNRMALRVTAPVRRWRSRWK